MSETQPERSLSEAESRLAAYHDGELESASHKAFEDELAHLAQSADASEPAMLEQWSLMGELVRGTLEQEAEALPNARFEQLWDEFDRTLARESRLQEAANAAPSFTDRLKSWLRPAALPMGLAAAAAIVLVVVNPGQDAPASGPDVPMVAEAPTEAPGPEASPAEPVAAPAPALAQKTLPEEEPGLFPQPESNDAEIEKIEFGGRSGTISHIQGSRGTTTVIWVQEDEEPVDSERSL
jgi:hypothetical protein